MLPSDLKKLENLLYWGLYAPVGDSAKRSHIHQAWMMVRSAMENLQMPEPEHKLPVYMRED